MTSVLLTAFEPYGRWEENSSWLTLVELTRELPTFPKVTTRLYPVDFQRVREKLAQDLAAGYDYAIHLGQAPGSSAVRLESFALNVQGEPERHEDELLVLEPTGPPAYQTNLPVHAWAQRLRASGIPAFVSYHAGIYLCNATLYLSHHFCERQQLSTRSAFIHLPLVPAQAAHYTSEVPSVPLPLMTSAIREILADVSSAAANKSVS